MEEIQNMLVQLSAGNYSQRIPLTGKSDNVDAVIAGLNTLAEELEAKQEKVKSQEKRLERVLEVLLSYTIFDFSPKVELSSYGDEIDAIAAGVNTLGEEMVAMFENEKKQIVQLEYSNKELDSFTYSVSHDLRSPLRAIHGFSKILLEDYSEVLDEEGKRFLNIIIGEAQKMGKLIDDLLALSRLGKRGVEKIKIDMTAIASSVAESFKKLHPEVEIKVLSPLPPANGDPSLLNQVFINLISNAVKYSSKSASPMVEIGSKKQGNEVIYYIKDNGVGFNMKYADKLFKTFHRLHTDKDFEGTGVGLAIVKRIIEHHEGRVWAEAKENEGAIFYFSLPF